MGFGLLGSQSGEQEIGRHPDGCCALRLLSNQLTEVCGKLARPDGNTLQDAGLISVQFIATNIIVGDRGTKAAVSGMRSADQVCGLARRRLHLQIDPAAFVLLFGN